MKRRGIFAGESHAYWYYTCKCLVTCKAHERHKKTCPYMVLSLESHVVTRVHVDNLCHKCEPYNYLRRSCLVNQTGRIPLVHFCSTHDYCPHVPHLWSPHTREPPVFNVHASFYATGC